MEIRSRNEEVIGSTRNMIYSLKVFYFLLYRRRYFLFLNLFSTRVILVPEVFLDFSSRKRSRGSREAATTSRESGEERERKTSGYLGLESHFHADDSCQTRQIANKKSDQWQLSKHVPMSRYFFKWG